MNDSRTVLNGHVITEDYAESSLVRTEPRNELFVLHSGKLASLEAAREYLIRYLVIEPGTNERLGKNVGCRDAGVWIGTAYLYVIDIRSHAERSV